MAKTNWPAVAAAGLSTFSVVTSEMLPVGLLVPITQSLEMSVGAGGLMLFVPAAVAALLAPLVVVAAGGVDRRRIICGLLALLVCANLATAFAPSMTWLLLARVLVGVSMGGIWAIAGGLASRLADKRAIGLATAVIFGGVAAASVLGVPLGAFIGDAFGWRMAFGAMAGLSALVLLVNALALPSLPVAEAVSFRQLKQQCLNPRLQLGFAITLFLVAGHFMAFTFVRPVMQFHSGVDVAWISPLLFGYGAIGIAGNFIAGVTAARHVGRTLLAICLLLALTLFVYPWLGQGVIGGAVLLLLWGLAYGGVSVSVQTWTMKMAGTAVEPATALLVTVFNLGIATGAVLGMPSVDTFGLQVNLMLAGGSVVVALLLVTRMLAVLRTAGREAG